MTGSQSNNQAYKSAKRKKRRGGNRNGNGNGHWKSRQAYSDFTSKATIPQCILPTNEPRHAQWKELLKHLNIYCSTKPHLASICYLLNGGEQKDEDDFLPSPVDRTRFTTTIQVKAMDRHGNVLKDQSDNPIMEPYEKITDKNLKKQLETKFDNKYKTGHAKYEVHEVACNAIITILEGLFYESIIPEVQKQPFTCNLTGCNKILFSVS